MLRTGQNCVGPNFAEQGGAQREGELLSFHLSTLLSSLLSFVGIHLSKRLDAHLDPSTLIRPIPRQVAATGNQRRQDNVKFPAKHVDVIGRGPTARVTLPWHGLTRSQRHRNSRSHAGVGNWDAINDSLWRPASPQPPTHPY